MIAAILAMIALVPRALGSPAVLGAAWTSMPGPIAMAVLTVSLVALLRADRSLRRAAARHLSVIECAPDAIVSVDARGCIRLVNDQFERVFGYARDEVLGQKLEILLPEVHRAAHAGMRERFQQQPRRRPMGTGLDLTARRRDGTEFPVEIALSPTSVDGESMVTAIVRDVTERRQAEVEREQLLGRALQTSAHAALAHARLEATLDSAPIAIVFAEAGSDYRAGNVVATEILGSRFDRPSDRAGFASRIHRLDGSPLPADEWPIVRALRGERVRNVQMLWDRSQGVTIVLEMSATPICDSAANVLGAVIVFQDVTARREAEQLRKDYLSLISHDLRAPLSSVALQAQLLQRDAATVPSSEVQRAAETIQRNAFRMNRMIEDLLDSARSDAGRMELTSETVDLACLVRQTLDETLSAAERRRVAFEPPAAPIRIPADRARIERLVINLVSNALKYSPAEQPVQVQLGATDGETTLAVSDRGSGIPLAEQALIFDKFYRATHPGVAGVGLGLYITRLLVEAHSGRISVVSAPGQGTTFRVTLPRARATAMATAAASATHALALPSQ